MARSLCSKSAAHVALLFNNNIDRKIKMKRFGKKYRHLLGLVAFTLLVTLLALIGVLQPITAFALVCCWQLVGFVMSKPRKRISNNRMRQLQHLEPSYAGCLFETVLTPDQIREFEGIMQEIKLSWEDVKDLPKEVDSRRKEVRQLRRLRLSGAETGIRWIGNKPFVTDDCARALTSVFILECRRLPNALESLIKDEAARKRIVEVAQNNLAGEFGGTFGSVRTALDSTTTPLPTVYVPQIVELVWHYGQARQFATVYPLGAGTVKLPRLKAGEDDFGYLGVGTAGMSQNVPEKRVQAELVTFTANKAGGIIRIPFEIEEDTFIPIGQFLARYIARQLSKLEDKTMFLGDGTATYANQTGVGPYCVANNAYLRQLAGGKTSPSDATLNDFRAIRGKINAAALVDDPAYYMHPSMEGLLVTFNTLGQPLIYMPARGGAPATLDGYPIRWVGVLQPYTPG